MHPTRSMRRRLHLLLLCFLFVAQIHTPVVRAEEENATSAPLRPFNLKRSGEVEDGRGVSGAPQFAPNSGLIVYSFAADTGDTLALYSVPTRSGEPTLLSPTVATGQPYGGPIITPDGNRVVYRDSGISAVNIDGVELYSVPIQGGARVKLNGALPTTGIYRSIAHFAVTPDSAHAIYVAPLPGGNGSALFRVGVTGGSPLQLSGAHGATGSILAFWISTDGSMLVYYSLSAAGRELYAVGVDGGAPIKVGATLPADRELGDIALSADGAILVYALVKSSLGTDREIAFYSAQTATGAATLLAEAYTGPTYIPLVGGYPSQLQLTANGSRVVYLVKTGPNLPLELFSIPVAGGAPTKLSEALEGTASSLGVGSFVIAPDSSRVVYFSRSALDEGPQVYSVAPAGGVSTSLGGASSSTGSIRHLRISPDSSQVVYSLSTGEILAVPIAGGTRLFLTQQMVAGAQIHALEIGPNGEDVYYVADQEEVGVDELFRVAIAGGGVQKINGQLADGGDVGFARWSISPDSSAVAYVADQETNDVTELFTTFDVPAVLIPIVEK